jgi:uncharacterized protein YdeI (YjbR/CyaY-like superfamily)
MRAMRRRSGSEGVAQEGAPGVAGPTFFPTPAAFRKWLAANHATRTELLVGFYKTSSGKPSITWPESVDEALCFGWIDGVRKGLDADAYTIRFTPRKPTSIWSAINVAKVATLRKAGRMQPAGEAAFAKRTAARTGVYSFERAEAAKLSAAESRALRANPEAAAFFAAQPPWYQRAAAHWIVSAKREDTRAKRLAALITDSAAGRTVKPLTRPATKP